MQTKLRVVAFAIVASLLWISPTSAVSQRATVQGKEASKETSRAAGKVETKVQGKTQVTAVSKAKKLKTRYIGVASWYGEQRQGRKMANGQPFDRHKLTAASWYFPLGTTIRVVNVKTGASVIVTITDRGPNLRLNRVLDLSEAAADQLGYVGQGLTTVFLYPMAQFETRAAGFDSGLIDAPAHQNPGEYEARASAVPM